MNCSIFFYYTDCENNPPNGHKVGDITFTQEDIRLDINIDEVEWPHGKSFPADSPECGFDGLRCVTPSTDITPTPRGGNSRIGRLNVQ